MSRPIIIPTRIRNLEIKSSFSNLKAWASSAFKTSVGLRRLLVATATFLAILTGLFLGASLKGNSVTPLFNSKAQAICDTLAKELSQNSQDQPQGNVSAEIAMLIKDANSETEALSQLERLKVPPQEANLAANAFAYATNVILDQRALAKYLMAGDVPRATHATSYLSQATMNFDRDMKNLSLPSCSIDLLS